MAHETVIIIDDEADQASLNSYGRLLAGKSTIISTNLDPDQIGRRYSAQIMSRLEGEFELLPFIGQDIRLLKREQ